jgi:Astacin (Peptidase family M12A)
MRNEQPPDSFIKDPKIKEDQVWGWYCPDTILVRLDPLNTETDCSSIAGNSFESFVIRNGYTKYHPNDNQPAFFKGTEVSLKGDCARPDIVAHEVMHALGVHHEQNRKDRDQYVDLFLENVTDASQRHNWDLEWGSDPVGPFDFNSIMLYSSIALAPTTAPQLFTMLTKDRNIFPNGVIPDNTTPSQGDFDTLQARAATTLTLLSKNPYCDPNLSNLKNREACTYGGPNTIQIDNKKK